MKPISLTWEGPQSEIHSLAKVNRNLCKYLQNDPKVSIQLKPTKNHTPLIRPSLQKHNSSGDVIVRHHWPPNWSTPNYNHWVTMQPWEFGAIPQHWYIPMKYWTDQIWVYSQYNKDCYVRNGIPAEKIQVIPLGVDETIYHYDIQPYPFEQKGTFRFVFVGGTIKRKGIDLLLQAYLHEFSADEDVSLVIKDFGTHSFYQGGTMDALITAAADNPHFPHIQYINQDLSEEELASLYKACDCLVHPYRGEGFGLPIIEAMACGTPTIVPDQGPSQDFCDASTSFLLPAQEETFTQKEVDQFETIQHPWWLKVHPSELQKMMRFVYEHRSLAKEKGRRASEKIVSTFTWKRSAHMISHTIKELVQNDPKPKMDDQEIIFAELKQAFQQIQQNQLPEAIKIFQAILSVYPDSLETHYNIAVVYMKQLEYAKAIEHLNKITLAMDNEPSSFQAKIWSAIGISYSHIQSFQLAMDAFKQAIQLDPTVQSLEITCLKKGIQKTNEQLAQLYGQLGKRYAEMRNVFRAEEMLTKALQHTELPDNIQKSLAKIQSQIESIKQKAEPTSSHHQIAVTSHENPVTWISSTLADDSTEADAKRIQQIQARWEPYFMKGDRVLKVHWTNQKDLHKFEPEEPYDGLLLSINEVLSPSDWLKICKQTLSWLHPYGKIIFLIENQKSDANRVTAKVLVETFLQSAGWIVKESHDLETEHSFYLVSQKTALDVVWQCPLFNTSGYAEEQKYFLEGIKPFPLLIQVQSPPASESEPPYPPHQKTYLSALHKNKVDAPIIHYQAAPAHSFSLPQAPISIGRTMFETDSLPSSWVPILNELTEIWVPSTFNRETFASAGVKEDRIHIISGTLDETTYHPSGVEPYPLPNTRRFKFLSVFDWGIRKGWDLLIRAYFEEFDSDDDVSLIMKVSNFVEPHANPYREIEEIAKKLGLRQYPHIQIINHSFSEEEMIRLYAATDCFVLPSRGEGWGRPYMEAMAMELPTIGTRWSGQQEFMNDENSYLIDLEGLIPVDPLHSPFYYHGHQWAEPSIDHLKALMRQIVKNPLEAKEKGRKARADLFPRFSPQTMGRQIFERMETLVQSQFAFI
ncbi:glycosyltransferase [Hazenella coriacea]|uniref:Glycosyltransferase involved in cell wall biosynthesis n=1 Tax=Hazenella coriacea TaxID=1179467 RepID=A0A4R3L621_9BACL|nr:glycosyltransferase [Hazenella coriacea]TCS93634.1 glycosyltransferase involved in cell wall biosynthesis [Hazenella coriacea]